MNTTIYYGPPGCGKTRTLANIAAHSRGQAALFLSYTKAAALEAGSRVGDHVKCSTLHSLAFGALGLSRQSVVTQKKLAEFGAVAGIPFRGTDGSEQSEEGDEYLAVLSYARNLVMKEGDAYDHFGRPGTPVRYKMCINAYEDWKTTYGFLDFDDMLTQATKVPIDVCPMVILDEAQDCSPLQWALFEKIATQAKSVHIAGDDDQAIYSWHGADPHGMQTFGDRHAATVKVLDQSWRVPKAVHFMAHAKLLRRISKRVEKKFKAADRNGVVTSWGSFENIPTSALTNETLILTRDNYRLREVQKLLHMMRTPYAMGTSNGPYENRYAKAIRGWMECKSGNKPGEQELSAMIALASAEVMPDIKAGNWRKVYEHNWRRHLSIPARMVEFYESADLFAPLNVKLSTIHQAKGTEADTVVLDLTLTPRVEQGIDLDADAELRVQYVGMTRAKNQLHLCGENRLL